MRNRFVKQTIVFLLCIQALCSCSQVRKTVKDISVDQQTLAYRGGLYRYDSKLRIPKGMAFYTRGHMVLLVTKKGVFVDKDYVIR